MPYCPGMQPQLGTKTYTVFFTWKLKNKTEHTNDWQILRIFEVWSAKLHESWCHWWRGKFPERYIINDFVTRYYSVFWNGKEICQHLPSSIFLMSYLRLSNLRRSVSFFRFSCVDVWDEILSLNAISCLTHHRETREKILDKNGYPDRFVEVSKCHCIDSKARLCSNVRFETRDQTLLC